MHCGGAQSFGLLQKFEHVVGSDFVLHQGEVGDDVVLELKILLVAGEVDKASGIA